MDARRGFRNLALYPIYVACLNGFFWFPVFFLYLTERVGLEAALELEAIYYLAVVVFEVPSGWVSDRLGRRFALRCAALLLTIAYVAFYLGGTMWELGLAQALLAAGFAFNSGTDTSFHYDSLVALGLETEFGDREERIARLSFAVVGFSALVGGLVGAIELRLAYLAAAVVMGLGFLVTLAFAPPEPHDAPVAERLDQQIRSCLRDARDPVLAWLFAASLLLTVLVHVPYQLYQPYLELLEVARIPGVPTPALTGLHACLAMIVASMVSSRSVRIARRFGLRATVLAALGFGILLIAALGAVLHPIVAVLLVMRSASRALLQAPMNAAVAPRIPRQRRASYLSLQSLAGRLTFSVLLFALSGAVAGRTGFASVSIAAGISALVCGLGWLVLAGTSTTTELTLEVAHEVPASSG